MPHMHYRGSHVSYEARYPRRPRRDAAVGSPLPFQLQSLYSLRTPKPVPAKTGS